MSKVCLTLKESICFRRREWFPHTVSILFLSNNDSNFSFFRNNKTAFLISILSARKSHNAMRRHVSRSSSSFSLSKPDRGLTMCETSSTRHGSTSISYWRSCAHQRVIITFWIWMFTRISSVRLRGLSLNLPDETQKQFVIKLFFSCFLFHFTFRAHKQTKLVLDMIYSWARSTIISEDKSEKPVYRKSIYVHIFRDLWSPNEIFFFICAKRGRCLVTSRIFRIIDLTTLIKFSD